jgi:sugar/nucleoside kinase (ribokinase family)
MSVLVCGSIAFDTVRTPFGYAERVLGGSAVYFSFAASFFTEVRLFGPIGEDFPEEHLQLLKEQGIDVMGVTTLPCKTFFWQGSYEGSMAAAKTEKVELDIFELFSGDVPEEFRETPYVFLANNSPQLQMKVVRQMKSPRLIAADTMNHWIDSDRQALLELLSNVDGLIINEEEAKMISGTHNLVLAGKKVLELGPDFVIIKKGEHGSILLNADRCFVLPAYPLEKVKDPTGAGDSFAGGAMGYIAQTGRHDFDTLKRAMACGTVMASINVEDFSLERFKKTTRQAIDRRLAEFKEMVSF